MTERSKPETTLQDLLSNLVAMIPRTKHQKARDLIEEFELTNMTSEPEPKIDGRSTAWDENRRAEASARWAAKRSGEVFYFYKHGRHGELTETKIKGVDECCLKLKIREAYLRSRLSSGRGYATFGSGLNKTTVTKNRFSTDPEEQFRQEFMIRHGREPGHHEYPGSAGRY